MNWIAKIGCRVFQAAFHLALPILPYREPEILESISGIVNVLQARKVKSVLLVTDPGLRRGGSTATLEALLDIAHIHCAVYRNSFKRSEP